MAAETARERQRIFIEPLDPVRHDRNSFSCGAGRLDNFLKRTARKHQAGSFSRVWVATDGRSSQILGYYALNAHSLEGDDLPKGVTRDAPRHGAIPAVYLSMIAVDRRQQGQGIGRLLLADALARVAAAAEQVGIKVVVLDVIEEGGIDLTKKRREFYTAMGFESLPGRPLRMFIGIETIRRAIQSEPKTTI